MKKGAKQEDEAIGNKGVANIVAVEKDVEEQGNQQDGEDVAEDDVVGKEGVAEDDAIGKEDVAVGKDAEEDDAFVDVDTGFEGVKGGEQEAVALGVKGVEQEDVVGEIGKGSEQGAGSDGVVVGSVAIEGDEKVKNLPSSVVALDGADPDVEYKDINKQRGRKRSRWLENPWTDPMPKKKRKPWSNEEEINLVEFTSFLKNDDQVR
ncbi:hypothetical protein Q3G72_028388 [Acer saccharum]|nr:hypothetical protein Q3G72_028388 [Acer saccharum]